MAKHPERSAPVPGPPRRPGVGRLRRRNGAGDLVAAARLGIALLVAGACAQAPAEEPVAIPQSLAFYEVELDDSAFADELLRRYLTDRVGLEFTHQGFSYENVIDILAGTRGRDSRQAVDGHFLARTTPYVFVVARTLGANLEVLATYRSRATDSTTYRSYFVVRREALGESNRPTRDDLEAFLLQRALQGDPARFVYHSQFSTSSYFVPSLYFREREIYSVAGSTGKRAAIHSEEVGGGSTDLVLRVARGDADLAAVWDGTKAKFEPGGEHYQEFGREILFIELETVIPNDLLVTSAELPEPLKEEIREAIRAMSEESLASFVDEHETESLGDFRYWLDFDATDPERRGGAKAARAALSGLCALTRRRPPPVVVQVEAAGGAEEKIGPAELAAMLEATEQAILLSSTELTLFDGEIHKQSDLRWELAPLHDEAVLLTSAFTSVKGIPPQDFRISHQGRKGSYKDLTQRIGDLIHSRLHRVRYLWPYQSEPTVIRDVAFDLPPGSPVKIQQIRWLEPEANSFRRDGVVDALVAESDYSTFRLKLREAGSGLADRAEPLSDIAHRVILLRPSRETWLLSLFTGVYVALMALAAVFAAVELRRRAPATAEAERQPPDLALVTG